MSRFLPRGFYTASIRTEAAKRDKEDLGLILSSTPCKVAAMYTTNRVQAAPLRLNQKHLRKSRASAIIVNSGNANAAAPNDMENARRMARAVAGQFGLKAREVLVASTGVIGHELEIEPIEKAIRQLSIQDEEVSGFNRAIMTTDTIEKRFGLTVRIAGQDVRIAGICKGSGMIHPNMATMLGFLCTDVRISQSLLDRALKKAVRDSFGQLSVDGDTSTNDMVLLMDNGLAHNPKIETANEDYRTFARALKKVCVHLAREMARDGEGAGKLVICQVKGALNKDQARLLSRGVISSNLLKAAIYGQDANWGRVLCAMGYSRVEFDPSRVSIRFSSKNGSIRLCRKGKGIAFDEQKALEVMQADEITIHINLHQGSAKARAFGCDLTHAYVDINADYRS